MSDTFARGRQVGPGELADIRAAAKTPAGPQLDVAPSREALQVALREGRCPFCGSSYQLMGSHTSRAHGYTAADLRELAGMNRTEPLCAPELSQAKRKRKAGKRLPDSAYDGRAHGPRRWSEAGRAVQRAKLEAARSPEQQRAAAAASGERTRERYAPVYAEIVRRWHAGEPMGVIAAELGVAPKTVRDTLRREGLLTVDGRRARWERLA